MIDVSSLDLPAESAQTLAVTVTTDLQSGHLPALKVAAALGAAHPLPHRTLDLEFEVAILDSSASQIGWLSGRLDGSRLHYVTTSEA